MICEVEEVINTVRPAELVKEMIMFVNAGVAINPDSISDTIKHKDTVASITTKHLADVQDFDIDQTIIVGSDLHAGVFVPMMLKDGSMIEAIVEFAWSDNGTWKYNDLRWTYTTEYGNTVNVWLFEDD